MDQTGQYFYAISEIIIEKFREKTRKNGVCEKMAARVFLLIDSSPVKFIPSERVTDSSGKQKCFTKKVKKSYKNQKFTKK